MNPALYAMFRSVVQYVVSFVFAHFAILAQFSDVPTAVNWTMGAVVFAGYVWLANWLGTRRGEGWWPKLAHVAAKVLMLGLAKTPSYPANNLSRVDGGRKSRSQ